MAYVIGVDVGGTFTDAVLDDDAGTVLAAKSPSTPPDYSRGVLDVLELLAEQLGRPLPEMLADTHHIAHGTTSSLNALVTGNVPAVGFLTTKGHRDSIFIMNVEGRYLGRSPHELQHVLGQSKQHGLLPKRHALEVTERIDRDGNVVVALDEDAAREAIGALLADGVRAIAVSLLWSFRNPVHERRLRELIGEADPDVFVALSSEVSPRIREFARNATTIMSTQIGPGLRDYLSSLEAALRERELAGPLLVMQSSGGAVAAHEAPASAISTVGSVLTGGVVGSVALGRQLGHRNIISTDVGGTTFLAGLVVDGEPVRATTTVINHHPINVPTLRVEAIGSGGGAIAWLDPGGNLRIGPRSAQAVPGPACYGGGGTEPTNTDANLVLGILPERGLLGGRKPLSVELARQAIDTQIAKPLGLTVEEAAAAIYAVQNAQTGDLLRKTVVEAGHDPARLRGLRLRRCGPRALRPLRRGGRRHGRRGAARAGGVGVLGVRARVLGHRAGRRALRPHVRPVRPGPRGAQLRRPWSSGCATGSTGRACGSRPSSCTARSTCATRCSSPRSPRRWRTGALDAAAIEAAAAAFEQRYAELYGKDAGFREAGIQAITFRVRGIGVLPFSPELPVVPAADAADPAAAQTGTRPVCLDARAGFVDTAIYDYGALRAGHVLTGPAIVEVPTTTVVVPAGTTGTVDHLGNLTIRSAP